MAGDGMRSQQLHAVFGAEDALVDETQVAIGSPASWDGRVQWSGMTHRAEANAAVEAARYV